MAAMPQWLCNQLMRAFYNKNRRQIQLLNDSWYFYRTRFTTEESGSSSGADPSPSTNGQK
jgi:hypothetical protein